MLQPINKYFKKIDNNFHISGCESKELSDESIKPSTTFDNSLALSLKYIGVRPRVKFDGQCLEQDKVMCWKSGKYIYLYTQSADFTLGNFFFGAVKLTKNADFYKYKYSRYGIWFDACWIFSLFDGNNIQCWYVFIRLCW